MTTIELSTRVAVRQPGQAEIETSWERVVSDIGPALGPVILARIGETLSDGRAYVGDGVSVRVVAS